MRTNEILTQIQRLSIQKRILVIEKTLRSLRGSWKINQMNKAADLLLVDYKSDKELTAFTNLDFDDFYQAR
jgi:hypothetical protein